MMFFDQLRARLLHGFRQNQLFKGTLRDDFIEEFRHGPVAVHRRRTRWPGRASVAAELLGKPSGQNRMFPRPLLGDQGLDRPPEKGLVAGNASLH